MANNLYNQLNKTQTTTNNSNQLQQVINIVRNSGKNPKDLFFELAKQKGIDPNDILRQIPKI